MIRDTSKLEELTYQKIKFYKHLRVFGFVLVGIIWANFCGFIDAGDILKPFFIWIIILLIHFAKTFGTKPIEKWIGGDWELEIMRKEYEKAGREEVPDKLDLNELKTYYKNKPNGRTSKSKSYSWDEGEIV
ncbi:MAG: 2TM domain-containing protein [Bacteroidota bacterium]